MSTYRGALGARGEDIAAAFLQTHGYTIQAEAVVNDAHTLYMIMEAPDQERVQQFMAPFAQVGRVEVLPASSCAAVVGRGGCAALP